MNFFYINFVSPSAPLKFQFPPCFVYCILQGCGAHTYIGCEAIIYIFSTCNTEGAVNVLECSRGLQYIGHTKRQLKVRIREHVQNIKKGYDKHIVSKH